MTFFFLTLKQIVEAYRRNLSWAFAKLLPSTATVQPYVSSSASQLVQFRPLAESRPLPFFNSLFTFSSQKYTPVLSNTQSLQPPPRSQTAGLTVNLWRSLQGSQTITQRIDTLKKKKKKTENRNKFKQTQWGLCGRPLSTLTSTLSRHLLALSVHRQLIPLRAERQRTNKHHTSVIPLTPNPSLGVLIGRERLWQIAAIWWSSHEE